MGDPDFLPRAPPTSACAAFVKESRMEFTNAKKVHRKFGGSPTNALTFDGNLRLDNNPFPRQPPSP
jgi:hypothetical protein